METSMARAAARTKITGANLPVPQSREAAAEAVRRIGELNRELGRVEADMNDQLARIKEQHEAKAHPLRESITALTEGVKIWAEANRAELTQDGKIKTADLGTGTIAWRLRPPRVALPRPKERLAELILRLKGMGLGRFVRTIEEVNREAMLAEPDVARGVPGVSIGSAGEDFVVEPFEAELAPAVPAPAQAAAA